jgi:hypothetical protein
MFEGFDEADTARWIVLDRHNYVVGSGLEQDQAETWARSIGGTAKLDAAGAEGLKQ